MMNRMDCLRALKRHVTDEIVVATYSTGTDWLEINDRPLNYFSFGAMGLASSMGISATAMHYGLMSWLSVVVVSAFESVGAILVIAMLILPGAPSRLLSNRLGVIMLLTVVDCAIASFVGVHLS